MVRDDVCAQWPAQQAQVTNQVHHLVAGVLVFEPQVARVRLRVLGDDHRVFFVRALAQASRPQLLDLVAGHVGPGRRHLRDEVILVEVEGERLVDRARLVVTQGVADPQPLLAAFDEERQ